MVEDECLFCRIAREDPQGQVFYADDDAVAFLDVAPAARGHTLVVPRRHADDVLAIDEDGFAALSRSVHRVARRLEDRLRPDGLTLVQSNRAAGWQDVFHLHVHLVPRWAGDALVRPWGPPADPADRGEVADLLR